MAGIFAGPREAWPLRLSALLCVGALVVHRSRWTIVSAAAVSLTATVWLRLTHPIDVTDQAGEAYRVLMWSTLESVALAALIVPVVRAAPLREAAALGAAAGLAESAVALRLAPTQGFLVQAFTVTWWSLAVAYADVLGLYLRMLDQRRGRAVEAARREQRMELARDLHDFVAHDLSGIVVQAQAAQVVADPAKSSAALRWIEEAGLQALAITDRTVQLLSADAERRPVPGLADLPELVRRFAAVDGTPHVRLEWDEEDVPREVGATAYRIVVEALANVRRHAPAAATVVIDIARTDRELHVRVTNDAAGAVVNAPVPRTTGGLGLVGLRERVEALGGAFQAGPHSTGWRVAASLPLTAR